MRQRARQPRTDAPSILSNGDAAWRAAVGLALVFAVEALDPPILAAALGAPLLAGLAPGSLPRPLRVVLEAIADASPLRPLLRRS